MSKKLLSSAELADELRTTVRSLNRLRSAGKLPEILFHDRSTHVRFVRAPTRVQLEMEPVMLLS